MSHSSRQPHASGQHGRFGACPRPQPHQPPKRSRNDHDLPPPDDPPVSLEQKLRAENKFLLQQAIARADIRLSEGRPRPIDLIVANLFSSAFLIEPLDLSSLAKKFKTPLTRDELAKDLRQMSETNEDLESFWNLIYEMNFPNGDESEESTAGKVKEEITAKAQALITGKSLSEVKLLKSSIATKLAQKNVPVDYDYWNVMHRIVLAQYKRLLVEDIFAKHSVPLARKSQVKIVVPNERFFAKIDNASNKGLPKQLQSHASSAVNRPNSAPQASEDSLIDSIASNVKKYTFFDSSHQAKKLYHEEANKKLHDDEQIFEMEVELPSQSHEPYGVAAIKPRYFAKVRAVYEWNKYNQTHYDIDNPPPKTIVGYQFRVFYPLLKDPSKAPLYRIESSTIDEGRHSCILRFIASEPYADLGFRIISDDWDLSAKHGFRCYFEDCVLYLRFNLRKSHHRSK